MNETYLLQPDLDRFVGLCSFGHLAKAGFNIPPEAPWDARITGTVHLDGTEYRLEAWVGPRGDGTGTEDEAWLKVQDRTLNVSALELYAIAELAPEGFETELRDAADQLLAMMSAGFEAITDAYELGNLGATIKHLAEAAATVRTRAEADEQAAAALTALVWNCSNTLLGRVEIEPSATAHLGYDIHAATLDPVTMKLTYVGIGWVDGPQGAEHSFRLRDAEVAAHSGPGAEHLLQGMDTESKNHYLHVFTHLHQIADAAGTYLLAMQHIAYADEGSLDGPLNFEERHETAHRIHTETAADLSMYTRICSEEPTEISRRH